MKKSFIFQFLAGVEKVSVHIFMLGPCAIAKFQTADLSRSNIV